MSLAQTGYRHTVDTPDTTQCPGCHQNIGVARPPGVSVEVDHHRSAERGDFIVINVGQVTVHECTLCVDGVWR